MKQNNWLVYATEIHFVGNEYNKAKTLPRYVCNYAAIPLDMIIKLCKQIFQTRAI